MSEYSIRLLGRLSIRRGHDVLPGLDGRKVQELLAYLLVHRGTRSRDELADALWPDTACEGARRYLRQCLWQLQSVLDTGDGLVTCSLIRADHAWVEINPAAKLWLDIEVLDHVHRRVQSLSSRPLDEDDARAMHDAVALYRGDLLEGCYLDWCLSERERLSQIHLSLLNKLMGYCETSEDYEAGLSYGMQSLRYDRASERTHRRMMRMHYLVGDRTAALQQYRRCVAALKEELDVTPANRTEQLYRQIQADQLELPATASEVTWAVPGPAAVPGVDSWRVLSQIASELVDLHRQLQQQARDVGLLKQRLR
jgi:DNA-binding SARP family transcriptional activator